MSGNRRGYGSGGGGGRFVGGGGGGGVNPWQSGTQPGRGSLLGNGTGLLNQLPAQDQIMLASKILSSLLPGQQGGPPSLMSLSGGGGGSGGPGSNYGMGNFGMNMGPGSGSGRFSGSGGGNLNFGGSDRGFRRDSDRRSSGGGNRRGGYDRNRDRDTRGGNRGGDKNRDKSRKDSANHQADAKQEGERKDIDVKRESNEGIKDVDVKMKKESDQAESPEKKKVDKKGDEKEESSGPLPGYEDIPAKLFHCHVCGKSMWNDQSFDTHVKGRNHRNHLRELEEDYQMQTNMMRQIAAMSLKLEEMRRGKRRPYPDQYCKMCDLHFNGMTMFAHRSTDEHQSLKKFIHPTCELCRVDFQVRVEYDEHLLTAAHLQNEAKALRRKEKIEKDPKFVALRQQQAKMAYILDELQDIGAKGTGVSDLSEEDKELIDSVLAAVNSAPDGEEDEDGHGARGGKRRRVTEGTLSAAAAAASLKIPEYDPDGENLIARSLVVPQNGFLCKVCKVFLLNEDVIDLHCRTQKHYEAFINQLKTEGLQRRRQRERNEKRKNESKTSETGDVEVKRLKTDAEKMIEGEGENDGIDEIEEDEKGEADVEIGDEYAELDEEETPASNGDTAVTGDEEGDENWDDTLDEELENEIQDVIQTSKVAANKKKEAAKAAAAAATTAAPTTAAAAAPVTGPPAEVDDVEMEEKKPPAKAPTAKRGRGRGRGRASK